MTTSASIAVTSAKAPCASSVSLRLARSVRGVAASRMVELQRRAAHADIVSFAIGMPAADLVPLGAVEEACRTVLAHGGVALQYGLPSQGLVARIVELMAFRGLRCREDEVFLTTGAQQAMDLAARLLLEPGGEVMIEEAVYEGIRLAVRPLEPRILTVPVRPGKGLDVEALAARLEAGARPAFLYLIPEGHNPLGTSMSAADRRRLLDVAERYDVAIVEDDAYGFLNYGGAAPPPLRALDENRVLYLGTFSKILAPGFRVGWILAPAQLRTPLATLKHGMDLHTTCFAQHVLDAYLGTADLESHIGAIRGVYRTRRDVLLEALERHFPSRRTAAGSPLHWHPPASGLYVWLELPPGLEATDLLEFALDEERVAFTPGTAFTGEETIRETVIAGSRSLGSCLRLCFATLRPETITEGVARLARAIERFEAGRTSV